MWLSQFIVKYWLEFVFGIIGTILLARINKIKAWFIELKQQQEEKKKALRTREIKECINELKPMLEEIAKQSIEGDTFLRNEINNLSEKFQVLQKGILTIQGDYFKDKCRKILKSNNEISFKDFENLRHDHNAYNALGGNSDGDELFDLVKYRYENQDLKK